MRVASVRQDLTSTASGVQSSQLSTAERKRMVVAIILLAVGGAFALASGAPIN